MNPWRVSALFSIKAWLSCSRRWPVSGGADTAWGAALFQDRCCLDRTLTGSSPTQARILGKGAGLFAGVLTDSICCGG